MARSTRRTPTSAAAAVSTLAAICSHESYSHAVCIHSECEAGPKLEAGCSEIVTAVCEADAFCCDNQWDGLCVKEAVEMSAGQLACDG